MKLFLAVGGLFIIIFVCIIPLQHKLKEYDTQKNGQVITATITYVPNCIGSKIRHFIKFNYDNKIYSKQINKPCEEYKVGEKLLLIHSAGTRIFLYENENLVKEFISVGLLALLGLFLFLYGFLKK